MITLRLRLEIGLGMGLGIGLQIWLVIRVRVGVRFRDRVRGPGQYIWTMTTLCCATTHVEYFPIEHISQYNPEHNNESKHGYVKNRLGK